MNYEKCQFNLHGHEEIYEFGKVAKQADGSVLFTSGDTVILATISCDEQNPVNEDFLPLTVQYIEKSYAAGRIPGGYVKRESKPSDFETLTSRIVDRTVRPLFPKGFCYPVVLTIMVLSVDEEADLQRYALLAANAAIYTSPLPIEKNILGVRIGRIDGEYVINPNLIEQKKSTLDLFVAGSEEELLMIEMRSVSHITNSVIEQIALDPMVDAGIPQIVSQEEDTEMREDELAQAISIAGDAIKESALLYKEKFAVAKKKLLEYPIIEFAVNEEIKTYILDNKLEDVNSAIFQMAKSERSGMLNQIGKSIAKEKEDWELAEILRAIDSVKKSLVRSSILKDKKRPDGRSPKEVREITIETNILPKAHGSCLFTRGQTQALAIVTLGGDNDRQTYDLLTQKNPMQEDLMLHYNFHSFCVNEARRAGPPGRRELGHGNLAKRAVESMIERGYENSIRVVSEILESNGSSSMATVCGSSLAMKAANVPVKKLVAGIAMGLVTEGEEYVILSDITGLEDHDGDMDFKVAGTKDGITAMQMDIKLGGISKELLQNALAQAKESRLHILSIMEEASNEIVVNNNNLPSVEFFTVSTDKIVDIIGQAGKTIRDLIERFEVSIDLDRDKGGVKVRGADNQKVQGAVCEIKDIVSKSKGRDNRGGKKFGDNKDRGPRGEKRKNTHSNFSTGDIIPATIIKIMEYGMLVSLPDANVGLIHISTVSKGRIDRLEGHFRQDQVVDVIFIGQDENFKIDLELKDKI